MTPLEHDELLTKCQIFEKETVTRPEDTNERSKTESKETEHGGDLSQNTCGESSYIIDSTVGQSFGEEQAIEQARRPNPFRSSLPTQGTGKARDHGHQQARLTRHG